MRMVVEAHLVDDDGCTQRIELCTIDRKQAGNLAFIHK